NHVWASVRGFIGISLQGEFAQLRTDQAIIRRWKRNLRHAVSDGQRGTGTSHSNDVPHVHISSRMRMSKRHRTLRHSGAHGSGAEDDQARASHTRINEPADE